MIRESLLFIAKELDEYMNSVQGDKVILNNIGLLGGEIMGTGIEEMKTSITLTLINIQEERTLKNGPNAFLENGKTVYKNRPVNLNLFLLFSVGSKTNYEGALGNLSCIIRFFQSKSVFNIQDIQRQGVDWNEREDIKLIMELYTMTFEEQNYLWSTLGGKQLPHVCYKLRLLQMERQMRQDERGVIKEISVSGHQI